MYISDYEVVLFLEEFVKSGFLDTVYSVFSIVTYVLTALALYTIANRRGIRKPWLVWIPVANMWILGSISDQYRYVAKGQNKSKRKSLLILSIIGGILGVIAVALTLALIVNLFAVTISPNDTASLREYVMGLVVSFLVLSLPLMGVAIARAILYYMALYDVYTSCDPSTSVLFLVLSILLGFTTPFFLFFSRYKDGGMPARRPEPASYTYQESAWQPTAPDQEPWEQETRDYL